MSQEEVCSSHRTPRLVTGHKLMTALRSLSNSLGYQCHVCHLNKAVLEYLS